MAVRHLNVGPWRVHITAWNPTNLYSLLACEFLLSRAAELLHGTTEADLRAWCVEQRPELAEVFRRFDAGEIVFEEFDPKSIDPRNAPQEAMLLAHLLAEQWEQTQCQPSCHQCQPFTMSPARWRSLVSRLRRAVLPEPFSASLGTSCSCGSRLSRPSSDSSESTESSGHCAAG